ncbi:hypothetical protein [Aeromicrobium sp. PE09-221]|uniref:hypothetical protein n=1 Tax=Aeromicrobium sp. PE09-221 TaxID=1898043 RepID=UPI0011246770|nr:hypothetical protein [Aeromicrobium sp. PE09-221]
MPTFEDAFADAGEVQHATRALAYAMRTISNPGHDYPVLLSLALGSAWLEFSLTQLVRFYETTAREQAEVHGDRNAGRATAQRVTEHLRAASECVALAVKSMTYAHDADSEITYTPSTVAHHPKQVSPAAASAPERTDEVNEPWL